MGGSFEFTRELVECRAGGGKDPISVYLPN